MTLITKARKALRRAIKEENRSVVDTCGCPMCGQPIGSMCRSPSRFAVRCHKERREDAEVFNGAIP